MEGNEIAADIDRVEGRANSRGEPRHMARTTKTDTECKTDDVPERGQRHNSDGRPVEDFLVWFSRLFSHICFAALLMLISFPHRPHLRAPSYMNNK